MSDFIQHTKWPVDWGADRRNYITFDSNIINNHWYETCYHENHPVINTNINKSEWLNIKTKRRLYFLPVEKLNISSWIQLPGITSPDTNGLQNVLYMSIKSAVIDTCSVLLDSFSAYCDWNGPRGNKNFHPFLPWVRGCRKSTLWSRFSSNHRHFQTGR